MIVRILQGSPTFEGILYNQRKINKGDAEFIHADNFGYMQLIPSAYSEKDYKTYLQMWSNKNRRIKDAQFHVSISAKGRSYSSEELVNIAKIWLEKMGYQENPVLFYFHKDTNNNHIHLLTSRIDKNGNKINNNFEKIRAVQVLNEIMKVKPEQQVRNDYADCLQYKFTSIAQFKALMAQRGYNVWENEKRKLLIRKGGKVLLATNLELFEHRLNKNKYSEHDKKRLNQVRAIFHKYKKYLTEKDFEAFLKNKFGLELHYHRKGGENVAYSVIDHKNRAIYAGKNILSMRSLSFNTMEQISQSAKTIIDDMFDNFNYSTTYQCNKYLSKYNLKLKDNNVCAQHSDLVLFRLSENQIDLLKDANKIHYVNSYNPQNESEAFILSKIFNVDLDRLIISSNPNIIDDEYYRRIIEYSCDKFGTFYAEYYDLSTIKHDGKVYILDTENSILIDTEKNNINIPIEPFERAFTLRVSSEFDAYGIETSTSLLDIFPDAQIGEIEGAGGNSLRKHKKKR